MWTRYFLFVFVCFLSKGLMADQIQQMLLSANASEIDSAISQIDSGKESDVQYIELLIKSSASADKEVSLHAIEKLVGICSFHCLSVERDNISVEISKNIEALLYLDDEHLSQRAANRLDNEQLSRRAANGYVFFNLSIGEQEYLDVLDKVKFDRTRLVLIEPLQGRNFESQRYQDMLVKELHSESVTRVYVAELLSLMKNPPESELSRIFDLAENRRRDMFANDHLMRAIQNYGYMAKPYIGRLDEIEKKLLVAGNVVQNYDYKLELVRSVKEKVEQSLPSVSGSPSSASAPLPGALPPADSSTSLEKQLSADQANNHQSN